MVLLTCGAIGVGVWGIIEGIHNTNGAVDDFFGVITDFGGEVCPWVPVAEDLLLASQALLLPQ